MGCDMAKKKNSISVVMWVLPECCFVCKMIKERDNEHNEYYFKVNLKLFEVTLK